MVQKRGKHCCNLVVATHGQAAPIICRIFMLILTFLFHKINIYRIHFFFFFFLQYFALIPLLLVPCVP